MTQGKQLDKFELTFTLSRKTPGAQLFAEVLGEQEYSDKGYAVGSLYIRTQAAEMIGLPKKIKVTIEPVE